MAQRQTPAPSAATVNQFFYLGSGILYIAGARDGIFGVYELDWETGKQTGYIELGRSHKFNAVAGLAVPFGEGRVWTGVSESAVTAIIAPVAKAARAGQAKEGYMHSNEFRVRLATESATGWAFKGGCR